MNEDEPFIRAIEASPDDDTIRLVYADWLDEHRLHDQAEYLRLVVAFSQPEHPFDLERLIDVEPLLAPIWLFRVRIAYDVSLKDYPPSAKIPLMRAIRE